MARAEIDDVLAFLAVAREGSFTAAAAKMGVSQSALSHTVRALEARMGVRLLHRTTRSVTPTEAGQQLVDGVAPRLEQIEEELRGLRAMSDKPAGTIRITAIDWVADTLLWPRLAPVLREYPDIRVEISTSYRLADIVAERFDLGVRSGAQVAKDMIAVRLSPDYRRMIVGSPAYFERHTAPRTPQDLAQHDCITMRLSTKGSLYAWELRRDKEELQLRVDGRLTFNNSRQILRAAIDGCGLAYTPELLARPWVESGALVSVLPEWQPVSPGFHLYYPSRRQPSRAFSLVLDALRYRA